MSTAEDKTIAIGEKIRTRLLNQPLAKFRRPDTKVTTLLNISALRFTLPDNTQIDLPLQDTFVIGRQQGNSRTVDLDLDPYGGSSAGISRIHAEVVIAQGMIYIRDMGSKNGVYLNNEELYSGKNYKLHDGDTLLLGSLKMRVDFVP